MCLLYEIGIWAAQLFIKHTKAPDAEGRFIRRYLPQLAKLPPHLIHAPWLARPIDLAAAGLAIGRDYPAPIVQHDEAREKTLERYAAVKAAKA
jgi:deoxyribodipyrimidine photo-lyase